jgi:hypothetical protein
MLTAPYEARRPPRHHPDEGGGHGLIQYVIERSVAGARQADRPTASRKASSRSKRSRISAREYRGGTATSATIRSIASSSPLTNRSFTSTPDWQGCRWIVYPRCGGCYRRSTPRRRRPLDRGSLELDGGMVIDLTRMHASSSITRSESRAWRAARGGPTRSSDSALWSGGCPRPAALRGDAV